MLAVFNYWATGEYAHDIGELIEGTAVSLTKPVITYFLLLQAIS